MRFTFGLTAALLALGAAASPMGAAGKSDSLAARENGITYLGAQGGTLSGGTKFGDLVFVSGQVPLLNGTVVPGGVKNETAFVIERIAAILEEAGSDLSKLLKATVLLQDIRDLPAVNEVYSEMIPNPKPARAAFEVGNLPVFGISVEIEVIAAL